MENEGGGGERGKGKHSSYTVLYNYLCFFTIAICNYILTLFTKYSQHSLYV